MPSTVNQDIAGHLDEVARILDEQGAGHFRIQAYHRAASRLRELSRPVTEIFQQEGLAGLENLSGVGSSIARSIRDIVLHGRLAMLDRLRGEHDPIALLTSVPGIGKTLAWQLHDDLGIDSLTDLEAAAHDGRLESLTGIGGKRLAGIRDSLAYRLGRVRGSWTSPTGATQPSVSELLDVDREYRDAAVSGTLKRIAPRRFNPTRKAWLPIMHTTRGHRHYTALFSNTARAHELGKTHDWVLLYFDGRDGEQQSTVITAEFGRLKGLRIVPGRENECEEHYFAFNRLPQSDPRFQSRPSQMSLPQPGATPRSIAKPPWKSLARST